MAQFPNTTTADGIWTLKKVRRAILGDNWPEVIVADDFFANTVLLLQADDFADGSQNNTFLDASTNTHTITRNGNVTQGSFSPFSQDEGKWANSFDGTTDYLSAASDTSFDCGTGNFTLEAWVYIRSENNAYPIICGNANPTYATAGSLVFGNHNTDNASYNNKFIITGSDGGLRFADSTTHPLNTWIHIAVVRDSATSLKMFRDGVQTASTTISSSYTFNWGLNGFRVGGGNWDGANRSEIDGYISNLRLVKGTAVYTTDFTPSTEPLTAISGTSVLTCQSNRFVDNSSNAHAITGNGDTEVASFSPFAPSTPYDTATKGGSGYFDGTTDYVRTPTTADFNLSTNDFCYEGWIWAENPAAVAYPRFFGLGPGYGNVNSFGVFIADSDNSDNITTYWNDGALGRKLISSTALPPRQWNHIAVVRNGSNYGLFLNGTRIATYTSNNTIGSGDNYAFVGHTGANDEGYVGYFSDVRLVNGSSVYDPTQTTLTVPSAPLTEITNTSLLLNATNAGIYDGTGRNVLETVGDAQVDTAVTKYGTGSMQFDGTDGIDIPNSPQLSFVAGEKWTMEMWINPAGNYSDFNSLIVKRVGGSQPYHLFLNQTTGYLAFFNGTEYSSTSTPTANVWSHVAYIYDGTNLNIYLNGTSVLSTAVTMYDTDTIVSIGYRAEINSYYYIGYIDDLRITKGVARYTANFTPPAAKLEQQ